MTVLVIAVILSAYFIERRLKRIENLLHSYFHKVGDFYPDSLEDLVIEKED